MTEQLHFHFSLSPFGEGNGNPLQCSCLENPRDRGAWWTAVYGVAQSRARLKRLKQQQQQQIPKMSMFTLAISWLTTSNLPWFMDLTFQVPMQYCSLQHWTLLLSPGTSTTGRCFPFGSISSFFLEPFFHSSPVAYWAVTNRGSSSFSVLSFALSYCSWGSQVKYTEGVCHSLLQWATFCQNSPLWPVHFGWPYTAWLIVSLS